ncbi:hypothetical protein KJ564_01725, partial [bacterium]|nr:hypothetical protein [bacterium]
NTNAKACKNCTSTRFPMKSKGLCSRCYPIILKLEKVRKWELNDQASLKGFPTGFLNRREEYRQEVFDYQKKKHIEKYQGRLDDLKLREKKLKGYVGGYDIECILIELAHLARSRKPNIVRHSADTFDLKFSPEQRKIIYTYLNLIRENVHWG